MTKECGKLCGCDTISTNHCWHNAHILIHIFLILQNLIIIYDNFILWFVIFTLELARVPEEAPPVPPTVSEPHSPAQSLSPNLPSRTEDPERPAERQPPLELPPEPCKVPVHVPMSNSILESLPMTHISTTLTGGTFMQFHCKYYLFFLHVPKIQTSVFCFVFFSIQKFLLHHLLSIYHSKSP